MNSNQNNINNNEMKTNELAASNNNLGGVEENKDNAKDPVVSSVGDDKKG